MNLVRFQLVLCCAGFAAQTALAQQHVKTVQTAAGRTMTNDTLWAVTAAGQSVTGHNVSADGRFVIYSGFLAAVLLQPWLDTDGDGLCDEMDRDNDGDGVADADELIADTDPNDPASVLAFQRMNRETGGVWLQWSGGIQARQVLMRSDSLIEEQWIPLVTNLPPTPVVTNFFDPAASGRSAFYRIAADRAHE